MTLRLKNLLFTLLVPGTVAVYVLSRYQEVSVPFRLRPRPEPAPPSYR